jgi:uncharacterized protein with PQ loop repeat
MVQTKGLHDLHVRKRIHEKKEKYPSEDKFKRKYDNFMYAIAILGPVMTLPQLLKIWITQDSSGVSILSWIGFDVVASLWLFYGIIHKEKQLIIMYIGFLILQTFIIVGAIIY